MKAERQPTNTSAPVPVDVARDLLAAVRALEARVAVLEGLLASAITPMGCYEDDDLQVSAVTPVGWIYEVDPPSVGGISDALSAALRLPTVPDAYGR